MSRYGKHLIPGLFAGLLLFCAPPAGVFAQQDTPPEEKGDDKGKPAEEAPAKDEPNETKLNTPALGEDESGFDEIELFTRVLEIVRQNYVDEEKVTYERLISSALEGMLADLDPHSQFMHQKVFEQLQNNTGSTYEGVGITISFRNEVLTIVTVREDGPAARAGVLPGDQILKINQFLTDDIGLTEAISLLKGKPGQKLQLTLRRPATKDLVEVEMVREVIKQETVVDSMMLPKELTGPYQVGYVRLLQFSEPTARELADALDELEDQGMDAFILDLRNNPGGLLNSAVDVAGEFVDPDTLILTTEGRPGTGNIKPYRTPRKKRRDRDYPIAILVNHSSASGSEVVAGALQDLKRAIIVGETTFGKGSVQSILPMGDGTAIRITTAKYYTPSKRTIHENGVIPNIIATLTPDEEQDLNEWFRRDTLPPNERKKLDSFQDRQLTRAVDAMKGALVYSRPQGDGGVPADGTQPIATAASDAGKSTPKPKLSDTAAEPEPEPAGTDKTSDKEKPAEEKKETPEPAPVN